MVGIVKTVDGVKKIVTLGPTVYTSIDANTPNNAIMMFSNATNKLIDSKLRVRNIGTSGKEIFIPTNVGLSYGNNTFGQYTNCNTRTKEAFGWANSLCGCGWQHAFGEANFLRNMGDSTSVALGSGNIECVDISDGLGLYVGVSNRRWSSHQSSQIIGLGNWDCGLQDLPAVCAGCIGISGNSIYGINNRVCTAWSNVIGINNQTTGYGGYCKDGTTPVYLVGTVHVFGNDNNLKGSLTYAFGNNNVSNYTLNSFMFGGGNNACGGTSWHTRYNQVLVGLDNLSRGPDMTLIGTANKQCADTYQGTMVGAYQAMCLGQTGTNMIGWDNVTLGSGHTNNIIGAHIRQNVHACMSTAIGDGAQLGRPGTNLGDTLRNALAIGQGSCTWRYHSFQFSQIRTGPADGSNTSQVTTMIAGCGNLAQFREALLDAGLGDHCFMGTLSTSGYCCFSRFYCYTCCGSGMSGCWYCCHACSQTIRGGKLCFNSSSGQQYIYEPNLESCYPASRISSVWDPYQMSCWPVTVAIQIVN